MPNITPPLLALTVALASILPARAEPLALSAEGAVVQDDPSNAKDLQELHNELAAFHERLSAWKLRIATDATWPEAWSELADLRRAVETAALASPKNENLRSLLSDLQTRAILWAAKLGDVEAASEWIVALSLRANERSTFPERTLSLAAAMTMAREDVREVAANLPEGAQRAALPKPGDQADDVVIARAVREAVGRGDHEFLKKLGTRAVPTLSDLAMVLDGSPIPQFEVDPLRALLQIDIATGLDVALELLRRDEYLLRKAVLDLIATCQLRKQEDAWVAVGETSWRPANPEWVEILRRLVEGVDANSTGLAGVVADFAYYGAIPRDLGPACRGVLETVSMSSSPPAVFPESGRWFYALCLESKNENVKETAIRAIERSVDARDLLSLTHDPKARFRVSLAARMGAREACSWDDETRQSCSNAVVWMQVDDAYVDALQSLLLDPDNRVSSAAFNATDSRSKELGMNVLDGPTLRSLMSRLDINGLGRSLECIRYLPESERLPTIVQFVSMVAVLEKDADHSTKSQYIGATLRLEGYGLSSTRDLWPLAAAIEREFGLDGGMLNRLADAGRDAVRVEGASLSEYLDWLEAHATESIWRRIVGKALPGNRNIQAVDSWMHLATSAERVRIVRLVAGVSLAEPGQDDGPSLWALRTHSFEVDATDLLELIRDRSAPLEARHWAARYLAWSSKSELTMDLAPVLTEILRAAEYRYGPETFAGNPDAPELANTILRSLVTDPAVPDTALLEVDMSLDDPELLELVIRRFPPESWSKYQRDVLIVRVVKALVRASVDEVDPRLAAANIPGSKLQETLAAWIGFTQSEALFPLLAEVMRTAPPYTKAWNDSIDAVTGYLSDDAAALLLETAKRRVNEEGRKRVLAALDQIVAWQDAAERWERGRDAAARRAEAISELTGMADDASQPSAIRAEALRGLGLLDAAEELPRLVRALTSDDEVIRLAAREAIERLHASDENDGGK